MAFGLGVRHGFDLDHLATIDSVTRTVRQDARLAKFAGVLFALGHGIVVILMSMIIASGIVQIKSPHWLETFGCWISIVFLLLFGVLTLWNILPQTTLMSTNFRTYLFRKVLGEKFNPLLILLVGALFAFSFDTFTQVTLFSLSASVMAGFLFPIILGVVFMLGMMSADGLNGYLVSAMIQLADKKSLIFSRVVGVVIAFFSLTLGILSLIKQL
jgi:nickel/cobalt transporter (NiCoT) family protein